MTEESEDSRELYVKLPPKYRSDKYINAFEFALYHILFYENNSELSIPTDDKSDRITSRIKLSTKGAEHFQDLKERFNNATNVDVALYAMKHIEFNPKLYP